MAPGIAQSWSKVSSHKSHLLRASGEGCEIIECLPQRFSHRFQPVQLSHRRKQVGGIRALFAARLQMAAGLEALKHFIQQQFFSAPREEPITKLAED